jgi:hypothetical protein
VKITVEKDIRAKNCERGKRYSYRTYKVVFETTAVVIHINTKADQIDPYIYRCTNLKKIPNLTKTSVLWNLHLKRLRSYLLLNKSILALMANTVFMMHNYHLKVYDDMTSEKSSTTYVI